MPYNGGIDKRILDIATAHDQHDPGLLPIPALTRTRSGRIIACNPPLALLIAGGGEIEGREFAELFEPELTGILGEVYSAKSGDGGHLFFKAFIQQIDRSSLLVVLMPFDDAHLAILEFQKRAMDLELINESLSGQAENLVGLAEDTELAREDLEDEVRAREIAVENLRKMATTDFLTGLKNRRAFMELATTAIRHSQTSGEPMSAMMLDIDHFKNVNDSHGHDVGDEVLKALSAMLVESLRGYDGLGRLGGEEFAIVLPGLARDGAAKVADRILATIRHTEIATGAGILTITCSIGLTELTSSDDYKSLLKRTDQALYDAKEAGRDRSAMAIAL